MPYYLLAMANPEELGLLQKGSDVWNRLAQRSGSDQIDLSNAKLTYADLSDAKLGGANLGGADLSDADLSGADLSRADLSRATSAAQT